MRLLGAFLRLLVAGALGAPPAPVRSGGGREGGRSGGSPAAARPRRCRRPGWRWPPGQLLPALGGEGHGGGSPRAAPASARLSLPAGPGGAGDRQRGAAR